MENHWKSFVYCPRLDHFVRFNPDGKVSRCGHMTAPPRFNTLIDMENSEWLAKIKEKFKSNQWPDECSRCAEIENENKESIRLYSIKLHQKETYKDYLQVGGVLDNICNAGCFTCDANHSTKIGSLSSRNFPIINNFDNFYTLPQEKIIHLDINGGEPSYSKNYKKILKDLPPNLKTLRLNTNCAEILNEIESIVSRGIDVTITVSFDGVGAVHELVRWPISWDIFYKNLMVYKKMPVNLNLWTTVSVLNIEDLPNIINFAKQHRIEHSYAYLKHPWELNVENKDKDQIQSYIEHLKKLRGLK